MFFSACGNIRESSKALSAALKISPSDPSIYALMAQVHAKQGDRDQTLRDIQSAERFGGNDVKIFTATGEALLTLGDRKSAMDRFSRALKHREETGSAFDCRSRRFYCGKAIRMRPAVRSHLDSLKRASFRDAPVTGEDFADAANLFLAMHDFDLAENYFSKAQISGASQRTVVIGLTNTYLAEGETSKAGAALASLGPANDFRDDYDYMMASANLYRQRQDPLHSLASFAQASTVAGTEDHGLAESSQYIEAEQQGRQINEKVSFVPGGSFAPALEDINVYTLDAKILNVTNPALLPPPRHSFQNLAESHYRVQLGNLPAISGFVGQGLTTGRLLFPSVGVVQDRNTYDTIINGGISPILRFGSNSITFNGGLQFTVRRDAISPVYMNQNLFRQFLYVSTSSFFNWVSFTGSAEHESGPFLNQNLHSRDVFANVEFTVGRPWGKTSLITGYSVRDLLFRPIVRNISTPRHTSVCNGSSAVALRPLFSPKIYAPGGCKARNMRLPRQCCREVVSNFERRPAGACRDQQ